MSDTTNEATLEAIYNINKHAKKYTDLAAENYQSDKGAAAKTNSLKKNALYRLKTKAINELLKMDLADRAAYHYIDGEEYICVWFGEWSFHQPTRIKAVHEGWFPEPEESREIEDFEVDKEKTRSSMSLKAALLHLEADLELNANDHFQQTHVSYGGRSYFVGWTYLGDGGELSSSTAAQEDN